LWGGVGAVGCGLRFGREQSLAKAKRGRLSKAADEAYFARRLRVRAGTVVAPGPRFLCVVGCGLSWVVVGGAGRVGVGVHGWVTWCPRGWVACGVRRWCR
jgi:hypothetical protein